MNYITSTVAHVTDMLAVYAAVSSKLYYHDATAAWNRTTAGQYIFVQQTADYRHC